MRGRGEAEDCCEYLCSPTINREAVDVGVWGKREEGKRGNGMGTRVRNYMQAEGSLRSDGLGGRRPVFVDTVDDLTMFDNHALFVFAAPAVCERQLSG